MKNHNSRATNSWSILAGIYFSLCTVLYAQVPPRYYNNMLTRKIYIPNQIEPYNNVNVYTEEDFYNTGEGEYIRFTIKRDIKLSKTISLNCRRVDIIGNGHKIYEYHNPLKNTSKGKLEYLQEVKGNELFITEKGKIIKLAESEPFLAESWQYDSITNICRIELPNEIRELSIPEDNQTYISYEAWFVRQRDKVLYAKDGYIYFTCNCSYKPYHRFRRFTPRPHFTIINGDKTNNGVVIRNHEIVLPKTKKKMSLSSLPALIKVQKNCTLSLKNVQLFGTNTCMLENEGICILEECSLTLGTGNAINSKGQLYVKDCQFSKISQFAINSISPRSYTDVSFCKFIRIGKDGSNCAGIRSLGDTYIGECTFLDANYCAIWVGQVNATQDSLLPSALIENNTIRSSDKWIEEQKWGLTDGGAIYVAPNNKRTIIQNNYISNFSGHNQNRGIFCDDGTYNVTIYNNTICGIKNSYDIDLRDCSTKNTREIPKGKRFNTNNYVGYNSCDGYIRCEGPLAFENHNCLFENNILYEDSLLRKSRITRNNEQASAIMVVSKASIPFKALK